MFQAASLTARDGSQTHESHAEFVKLDTSEAAK